MADQSGRVQQTTTGNAGNKVKRIKFETREQKKLAKNQPNI